MNGLVFFSVSVYIFLHKYCTLDKQGRNIIKQYNVVMTMQLSLSPVAQHPYSEGVVPPPPDRLTSPVGDLFRLDRVEV